MAKSVRRWKYVYPLSAKDRAKVNWTAVVPGEDGKIRLSRFNTELAAAQAAAKALNVTVKSLELAKKSTGKTNKQQCPRAAAASCSPYKHVYPDRENNVWKYFVHGHLRGSKPTALEAAATARNPAC